MIMPPVERRTAASGLAFEMLVFPSPAPQGLLVLMPSALNPQRADRAQPHFHRWTWAPSWADQHVLVVADPAVRQDPGLDGAWFIHPGHDVIRDLAEVVMAEARRLGLEPDDVVFYGSSLGGFGALGAAAHARARAVAEVPQTRFDHWKLNAIQAVEQRIIGGPLNEYRMAHPEQIEITARFEAAGHIPSFTIVSNEEDFSFRDQLALLTWVREQDHLPEAGRQQLLLATRARAHRPFDREGAVELLRACRELR